MDVVVSDTNIFIDLLSVDLLNDFFKLPFCVHTVDYVMNELNDNQRKIISNHNLIIKEYTENEQQAIFNFQSKHTKNVSFTDCAVWLYAKEHNYRLLTGDKLLRNLAIIDKVTVSGILFVFDMLVEFNIISKQKSAKKLQLLNTINNRLPKEEIKNRITEWSK
jgi:predicted nucleic acid-binding protein